jgi:poly-gamma-glutamate synthesis protein (capsule biosynthesis protein)
VGNHTHVIQPMQVIDGVPVFYSLGNFIFDQDLNDHQQSLFVLVRFEGTRLLDYELIPVHVDEDGRAHLAEEEEAAEILERFYSASELLK